MGCPPRNTHVVHNDGPADPLILRPMLIGRILMWFVAGCGLLIALGALVAAEEEGLGAVVPGAAAAMFFLVLGTSRALSRAIVSARGVTYWNLVRRRIASSTISAVRVGKGSGANYPRLAIWIDRTDSRPLRLTALQRPESTRDRLVLEEIAQTMATIIGVTAPAEKPER